jgi:hypothetical protein
MWAACQLFGILPPGVESGTQACWDSLDVMTQARLIAFYQTREHEEMEEKKAFAGIKH